MIRTSRLGKQKIKELNAEIERTGGTHVVEGKTYVNLPLYRQVDILEYLSAECEDEQSFLEKYYEPWGHSEIRAHVKRLLDAGYLETVY